MSLRGGLCECAEWSEERQAVFGEALELVAPSSKFRGWSKILALFLGVVFELRVCTSTRPGVTVRCN